MFEELLIYGKEDLKNNSELSSLFFKIFQIVTAGASEDMGYTDLVESFEYAQTFILSLEEVSNGYIPSFLECVLSNYPSGDKNWLKVHLLSIVIMLSLHL